MNVDPDVPPTIIAVVIVWTVVVTLPTIYEVEFVVVANRIIKLAVVCVCQPIRTTNWVILLFAKLRAVHYRLISLSIEAIGYAVNTKNQSC